MNKSYSTIIELVELNGYWLLQLKNEYTLINGAEKL